MQTDDLEAVIRPLAEERMQCDPNSARYKFLTRQLRGLRYTREEAGGIIEDVDPFGWGDTCNVVTGPNCPAA
jgi:hypothetical protein